MKQRSPKAQVVGEAELLINNCCAIARVAPGVQKM
jgi:hypothetical protein